MKFPTMIFLSVVAASAVTPVVAQTRPDSIPLESMGAIVRTAMRQSNPARVALDLRDSLGLSGTQVRELEVAASRSDSVITVAIQVMQGTLRDLPQIDQPGGPLDEGKIREVYQRRGQAEADFFIASYRARQAIARILTSEQQQRFDAQVMAQLMRAFGGVPLPPGPTLPSASPLPRPN